MKYLKWTCALLALAAVVYAAQDTDISNREVRDPKKLETWLETNASDVETRLAVVEASGGTTNSVTIQATKDLIAISDNGATTNTIISNGVIDAAKIGAATTISAINGAAITNLAGGNIASGNIALARMTNALVTTGSPEVKVDGKYAIVGGDATTGLMALKGAVTSGTNATETVTFGTVFGAAPIVVCTYTEDPGEVRPIFVTSVTTSNFVANITADKNFGYVAIGTRP